MERGKDGERQISERGQTRERGREGGRKRKREEGRGREAEIMFSGVAIESKREREAGLVLPLELTLGYRT
jgi:hypothetical protein